MKDYRLSEIKAACQEVNGECKKCKFVVTIDINATTLPVYAIERHYCCPFAVQPYLWNDRLIREKGESEDDKTRDN